MSFFVFDIIEIECEFDYSIFSEISPMGLLPSIYGSYVKDRTDATAILRPI